MKGQIILIVGSLLLVSTIVVVIYCVTRKKGKKGKKEGMYGWSCTEGHCERVLNGDHSSLEKCRDFCMKKKGKKVNENFIVVPGEPNI